MLVSIFFSYVAFTSLALAEDSFCINQLDCVDCAFIKSGNKSYGNSAYFSSNIHGPKCQPFIPGTFYFIFF
jgi:hypothetical protein